MIGQGAGSQEGTALEAEDGREIPRHRAGGE